MNEIEITTESGIQFVPDEMEELKDKIHKIEHTLVNLVQVIQELSKLTQHLLNKENSNVQ